MKGETIASVFLCTLFGALVYFDSRSVISTGVYATICFFLFSRWSRHANKENLASSKYTKLMSVYEAQMKKITEQRRSLELLLEEKEETQKELENKSDEAEELKRQLTAAQEEQEKLRGFLEKKEQEAMKLTNDLEAVKEEKDKLEQRHEKLKQQRDEESKEHNESTKKLEVRATTAEAKSDLQEKTVKDRENEIEGLKKEVKVLEQKERNLEEEKEELTFKIQRRDRTIHRMDEMRQAIDHRLDLLNDDFCDVSQAEAAEPSDKKEEGDSQSQEDSKKTTKLPGIPDDWNTKLLESPDVAGDESIHKALKLILSGSQETGELLNLFGERFDDDFGPMKNTPLMYACLAGNKKAYYALLKAHPREGLADDCGNNILHLAVLSGNDTLASVVSSHVSLQKEINNDGVTPLLLAAQMGNVKMVESLMPNSGGVGDMPETMLLAAMQPLHTPTTDDLANRVAIAKLVLERTKNKVTAVDVHDEHGNTPLHYACRLDCPELVSLLLKEGAKMDTANMKGKFPIDYAVSGKVRTQLGKSSNLSHSTAC